MEMILEINIGFFKEFNYIKIPIKRSNILCKNQFINKNLFGKFLFLLLYLFLLCANLKAI